MFYVVCVYVALGVLGMLFLPTYMPDTPQEKLQKQKNEKKLQEKKEQEDVDKWINNA